MASSASVGSVATVASLVGQAWAKSADGKLRPLAVGDTIAANEAVVTARGAQVELDFGDGRPMHLGGGQEVVLNLSLWHDASPDNAESHRQDAALQQSSVAKALKVLNTQGDLLDNLEETAAGGATNQGHNFVQLTRVIEHLDPAAFRFAGASSGSASAEEVAGQTYINRPPVVEAQTFGGDEDTLITGKIVATDLENDALTYGVVTQSAHGSVSINATTGEFTYTPVANYNGADSFVVIVTDTHGNQTTGAVSFTINAVNDAPVSQNQSLTTLEDTPLTGTVTATDVEGDTLAYSVSTNASHGVVTVNPATGAFVYTPVANYSGVDSFVVTVDDGHGGKTTSTISVGVTAVNDAPVTANQSVTTNEDTAYNGKIIATDVDGDTLAYSVTTPATNGAVVIDAATGAYAYTPKPNFFGADTFVVTVNDGHGGTTTSTVTVAVTSVNDAPVATNLNLNTPEDTPITSKVIATDVDGDTLAYSVSTPASHGNVVLNPATGSFVYTPNNFYNGADSFVVTVNDGHGGTTTSTVNLNISGVNNAPTTTNQNLTTAEDTQLLGTVIASDMDGDTLNYALSTAAAHGTVLLDSTTGDFTYKPATNYNGNDSFVVTVSDGNGGVTTSTISIGVTAVNDAPSATNQNLTTQEDVALIGNISANDIDGDVLTYSVSTGPAHGSVVFDPLNPKQFTYTPSANYNGLDSFVVTVNDGHGGTTTSTVSVNVTSVNDAPTATNQTLSTAEDTVLNGNIVASDLDADTLTYSVSTAATHGVVNVDANTGAFVYTPAANYNGNDSFVVTVSDGHGGTTTSTISVGVTPANDAPTTSLVTLAAIVEDSGARVITQAELLSNANDIDGDTLTASNLTIATGNGTLVNNGNGTWTYTPASNDDTGVSFNYSISDGTIAVPGTATLDITPVADIPVIDVIANAITEGSVSTATVVATFTASDADVGDTLTYTLLNNSNNYFVISGNQVLLTAAGVAAVDNDALNLNSLNVTVQVSDGVHTAQDTDTSAITRINDSTPTIDVVANAITEGSVSTSTVVATFTATDADAGSTLTYSVLNDTNGYFQITGNQVLLTAAGVAAVDNDALNLNSLNVTVQVSDGLHTAQDTDTSAITRINDSTPTIDVIANGITEGSVSTATVVATFTATDADAGSTLTYSVLNDTNGYFQITGNQVLLTAAGVAAVDNDALNLNSLNVTVQVSDGLHTSQDTDTSAITRINDSTPTIDVVANAITEGSVSTATVVATFTASDADVGDTLTYTLLNNSNNYFVISGNQVLLTAAGVAAVDNDALNLNSLNVTVQVSDGIHAAQDTDTSAITRINDSTPTIDVIANAITEGSVSTATVVATFTASDADVGDTLTYTLLNNSNNYFVISGNQVLLTAAGVAAVDSDALNLNSLNVTVQVSDGIHAAQDTDTSAITRINDSTPTIDVIANAITEGSVSTSTVVATINASDADAADTLTYSVLNDTNGYFQITGNQVLLTAAAVTDINNRTLKLTSLDVTVQVSDGVHTAQDTDTSAITRINTAPIAVDDPYSSPALTQGLYSQYYSYHEGADGSNLVSLSQITSFIASHGPDAVFVAKTFNYGADNLFSNNLGTDDNLIKFLGSDSASLSNTTGDSSDAVIKMSGNIQLDAGTYNFRVRGDDGYQIKIDGVEVAKVDGIQPPTTNVFADFTVATTGQHNIEVLYWDQGGRAVFQVEMSNDGGANYQFLSAQSLNYQANYTMIEDTSLVVAQSALLANDTDANNDPLSITQVSNAAHGSVSLQGGNVVFTPDVNYNGTTSFDYTVSDGQGGTSTATVRIDVISKNDAPVANLDTVFTTQDNPVSINFSTLIANDSDADGNSLSLISSSGATDGTLVQNSSDIQFTPAAGFNGVAGFDYRVSDGQGASSTGHVSVVVANVSGDAGDNNLVGGASNDTIVGFAGNDTLTGNGGGDLFVGGKGNDVMTGGLGADTFAWQLGDQGSVGTPAADQVNNFTLGAGGDALNISDLLQGENSANLTNYLHFESDGTNTTVSISSTGGFSGGFNAGATDQTIVLNGVNLSGGDAAIINLLKTNSNLITD